MRCAEKFDKEKFDEMEELVTKAIDERDAKYDSTRSHIAFEPQTESGPVEPTARHQRATLESFASQEQEFCNLGGVHDLFTQHRPATSGVASEAEAEDEAEADIL